MTVTPPAQPGAPPLEAYLAHAYELGELVRTTSRLPLPDEGFVPTWRRWADETTDRSPWAVLANHLPQLRFPIASGIRGTDGYRSATTRGASPDGIAEATGLPLERPDALRLEIYSSAAGAIPVLRVSHRPDFVLLVQALGHRNEPVPVPPSQGALFVSGYVNWERVAALRRSWEATPPEGRETATWAEELARLRPHKDLYQDRFVLLSDGPYSALEAAEMDLSPEVWRERSYALRREHEATHYLARRLFGAIRSHLLDELSADYAAMVAVLGGFRAATWLRFLGLGESGEPGEGARVRIYCGDAGVSDGGLAELGHLLTEAASQLEAADRTWLGTNRGPRGRALAALSLLTLPLDRLADAGGEDALKERWRALGSHLG